jgi:murein DD-endopeptidase MepM/ murein hydrolase activator NlpD
MGALKTAFAAFLGFALASCTTQPSSSASLRYGGEGSDGIRVGNGDTVYEIARRHGVSVRDVITKNDLSPPYILSPGEMLLLPGGEGFYRVKKGDSLYGVASRYKTSPKALASANNMRVSDPIKIGSLLQVPHVAKTSPALSAAGAKRFAVAMRDNDAEEASPLAPSYGRRHAPVPRAMRKPSGTPVSDEGEDGASGFAAMIRHVITREDIPGEPVSSAHARSPESIRKPAQRHIRVGEAPEDVFDGGAARPVAYSSPLSSVESTGEFDWPLRGGRVVSPFGPKQGGLYNEGVNIAAPEGTPVMAAEDGTVVYSGNELRGYGNLVLVKHPNGYITTYAHNSKNAVRKGDRVRKGQTVALVGKSGHVSSPQLHFSIRQGKQAIDPGRFFQNL